MAQHAAKPSKKEKALRAEFTRLQDDCFKATQIYFKPIEKMTTFEEMKKAPLDPAKAPQRIFIPKLKEFAAKAFRLGNRELAAEAWVFVYSFANNGGLPGADPKAQEEAFNTVTTKFANTKAMESLAMWVSYAFYEFGDQRFAKTDPYLLRLQNATSDDSIKASIIFTRANLIKDTNGPKSKSLALLDTLIEKYPNTRAASQATKTIYEIVHLSVGSVAPDFEAEDENGVKFKLSDYRGKVVMVDFWGFW